jgi:hypothetical protein
MIGVASGDVQLRRRRPLRRAVRNALVAVASFAIGALAISYVLLPRHAALDLSVHQDGSAQLTAYYRKLPPSEFHPQPPHRTPDRGCPSGGPEVLYGSITGTGGVRLSDVTVEVEALDGHGHSRPCGQLAVGPSGAYRSVLHLAKGEYRVTVDYTANHHRSSESRPTQLRPGQTYRLSGVVRSARIFSFLPVTSY